MSGRGSKRADNTGRSTSKLKPSKAIVDVGSQWIGHPRSMRESPSWAFLSWQARKIIDRLEIEHMAHAGQNNGRLGVSYRQFEQAGVSERCIARALVETMAAGLVERTLRGGKSVGDFRPTSLYRLTYLPADGLITHEWFALKTPEEIQLRFERLWSIWKEENPSRQKKADAAPSVNSRRAS